MTTSWKSAVATRTLDAVLALDLSAPGIAGVFLRAPLQRRHVMAAYLAHFVSPEPLDPEVAGDPDLHADRLCNLPNRTMLEAAHGGLPAGFTGAVQRSGDEVADFDFYLRLLDVLVARPDSAAAKLLCQMPVISERTLTALELLPPKLHLVPVFAALRTDETLYQLSRIWALFEDNGIATAEARNALQRAARAGNIDKFLTNWPLRLSFPLNPIADSERYTAVTDGFGLRRIALAYRNCARGLLPDMLDGATYLGEYRPLGGRAPVLLRFVRTNEGPVLEDINGYRNREIEPSIEHEVHEFVHTNNISVGPVRRGKASSWEPLRRQMRIGHEWNWEL